MRTQPAISIATLFAFATCIVSSHLAYASVVDDSIDPNIYYETVNVLQLSRVDMPKQSVDLGHHLWVDSYVDIEVDDVLYLDSKGSIIPKGDSTNSYYLIRVVESSWGLHKYCPNPPTPCNDDNKHKITNIDNDGFLQVSDLNKEFAMPSAEFDQKVTHGDVTKLHATSIVPTFRFGTALTLPFKLHRKTDKHSRDLTTDATVAGYFGPRWRLSESHDYFLNLVLGAGFALLPNTTVDTVATTPGDSKTTTKNSLIPGITVSGGVVGEIDGFQLGIMIGKDYATGIGNTTWPYNDEWWYALGIGFTFFGGGTSEPAQSKK